MTTDEQARVLEDLKARVDSLIEWQRESGDPDVTALIEDLWAACLAEAAAIQQLAVSLDKIETLRVENATLRDRVMNLEQLILAHGL